MLSKASTACRLAKVKKVSLASARVAQIGPEQALDPGGRVLGLGVRIDQPGDLGVRAVAAADMDIVALSGVLLADRDFDADQPDVADVMLGRRNWGNRSNGC